jgi:hypothetical protein
MSGWITVRAVEATRRLMPARELWRQPTRGPYRPSCRERAYVGCRCAAGQSAEARKRVLCR